MNKMMFPFQRCNSVSKCSFREFRPFSVIAENHWPSGPKCSIFYSISLSLWSAVDEQINGNLFWPEDLFSTLVAQSPTLQQHNFDPVATSILSVCITVLA